MNKDNFEESNKILEEEEKNIFSDEEIQKAREELKFLGIANDSLYEIKPDDRETLKFEADDEYYKKSA